MNELVCNQFFGLVRFPCARSSFFFIGVSRGERPLDVESWFAHPRTMSRCFQLLLWLNVEWRCYKKQKRKRKSDCLLACKLSLLFQDMTCEIKTLIATEKRKKKERTSFVSNVRGNIFSQNVKSLEKMFCVLLWKNWLCKLVFIFVQSFK